MDFRGRKIDLVGKQNLWFGISLAFILIGMFSWIKFGLNLGIDFKGGGQYSFAIPASKIPGPGADVALVEEVTKTLNSRGMTKIRTQIAGGKTLVISTDALPSQLAAQEIRVSDALTQVFGEKPAVVGQQSVGPVIGEELRQNAIMGVVFGVFLIALWIYIRYNFAGEGQRYAVAGIAALIHDVLVLIGLFALIGHIDPRIEIDSSFIAALLTVVGYSINDSVVIFDRIRENLKLRRRESYLKVVNDSLLETMSRSVNTGMTVLIMLFALLWFGGESMYNFVLAMIVGIASGLYSSVFNASMVLVAWHRLDEKKAAAQLAARATASSPRTARVAAGSAGAALSAPTIRNGARPAQTPTSPAEGDLPVDQADAAKAAEAESDAAGGRPAAPRKARSRRRF